MTRWHKYWPMLLVVLFCTIPSDARAESNITEWNTRPRFNDLATWIVGSPTEVRCVNLDPGIDGEVWFRDGHAEHIIYMRGDVCGYLNLVVNYRTATHRVRSFVTYEDNLNMIGNAIMTIEHESMHIKLDNTDESITECTALRNVWNTIKYLGLSRNLTKKLYRGAIASHNTLPSNYRVGC